MRPSICVGFGPVGRFWGWDTLVGRWREVCGQESSLGGCGLMEDIAHLLGAVVGDFDTDVCLICHEGITEVFLLGVG